MYISIIKKKSLKIKYRYIKYCKGGADSWSLSKWHVALWMDHNPHIEPTNTQTYRDACGPIIESSYPNHQPVCCKEPVVKIHL